MLSIVLGIVVGLAALLMAAIATAMVAVLGPVLGTVSSLYWRIARMAAKVITARRSAGAGTRSGMNTEIEEQPAIKRRTEEHRPVA